MLHSLGKHDKERLEKYGQWLLHILRLYFEQLCQWKRPQQEFFSFFWINTIYLRVGFFHPK
jgi:hypothetical protein